MSGFTIHEDNCSCSGCKEQVVPVVCEQPNCAGHGKDEQFFCMKCNMQVCSVCRFAHRDLGCEKEGWVLRGTREENVL